MSRIYWDTMLFVYLIEAHPEHGTRVREIQAAMEARGDSLCTSVFTIGELLTAPYRRGADEVADQIKAAIRPPAVEILPFTSDAADRYAKIRSRHHVAPADAIHLAAAGEARVNLFLTNDLRLRKLTIPGIDFIAGLDVNLF